MTRTLLMKYTHATKAITVTHNDNLSDHALAMFSMISINLTYPNYLMPMFSIKCPKIVP